MFVVKNPCRVREEYETLSTNAIPKYSVATELPPSLKKGRVMPITGSKRRFIPKLIRDWNPI